MIPILLLSLAFTSNSLQEQLDAKKQASQAPKEFKEASSEALKKLKESGIEKKALQGNAKIPDFSFKHNGEKKKISDYYKKGTTVVHFFRGGWCPYCMLEMKAYEEIRKNFQKAGIQVLHFTPDTPSEIEKTKKKHGLGGTIISDRNNKIGKKLGIAFELEEKLQKMYKEFGIDLEKSQKNKKNEIPMPAVYIVDSSGKIRYTFLDVDYTKRAEPSEVLKEAKKW